MDFAEVVSVIGAIALIGLVLSFSSPSLSGAESVSMHLRSTLRDAQSQGPTDCLTGVQRYRCQGTNILIADCIDSREPPQAKYCSDGCILDDEHDAKCNNPSGVPLVQGRYW